MSAVTTALRTFCTGTVGAALILVGFTTGASPSAQTSQDAVQLPATSRITAVAPAALVASADPGAPSCTEGSRKAAAAIARATTVTEPTTVTTGDEYDSATIKLRYSEAARCAWGWIGGAPGAQLWLERTRASAGTSGTTDLDLSHRDIHEGNESTYTGAYSIDGDTQAIRACGQVREAPVCTDWFGTGPAPASDAGDPTDGSAGAVTDDGENGDPSSQSRTDDTSTPAATAQAILDQGSITLQAVHESQVDDTATAAQNISDTAAGDPAHLSHYVNAPGGTVRLDNRMLTTLLKIGQSGDIRVSEIAGGSHSPNSRHYRGTAFDLDQYSMPASQVISQCKAAGARYAAFENGNHVHCDWGG